MIPNKDKEKMEAVKKTPGAKPAGSSSYVSADAFGSYTAHPQPASSQKSTPEQSSVQEQQQQQQQQHQQQEQRSSEAPLFRGGTSGFKPFASNLEKQRRYERYLEIRKQGKKCKFYCR